MQLFSFSRTLNRLIQSMAHSIVPSAPSCEPDSDSDVVMYSDVMVTMRDGARLATDVYLPARNGVVLEGQFPVILERTPYGKHLPSRSERTADNDVPMSRAEVARFFVSRGYAVVYQDCRGRYGSEGAFVKYTSDGNDGYDTCAWLVKQAWCNGRIGTKGLSYAAHTQVALASLNAPGVAAMFVDSGGFSNAYQGGIRQGGAFELKQVTWALRQALESPEVQQDKQRLSELSVIDVPDWFDRIAQWKPGFSPLSLAPEYEEYLFDQWRRGTFDEYWKQAGLYAEGFYEGFCEAAMVHMSSWYDPYPRTATENFVGLSKSKKGPVCLIIGPWTHGNRSLTYAGDVDFGKVATLDGNIADSFLTLRLQWFDRWLKNDASHGDVLPKVRLFVMGGGSGRKNQEGRLDHGGCWRDENDWPIADAVLTRFYLHESRLLSTKPPTLPESYKTYDYNPADPVPTVGGAVTSGEPLMIGGAYDQREGEGVYGAVAPYRALADRPDVLVFQTPPLEEDMEITGEIQAVFWISSNCPDTDFTFKLIDVYPASTDYPSGYAMNLTDGIIRTRYRESWERPQLMTPGEIYKVQIDAFPTSNLFKKGHCIRIDVSSSNFPRFDCNSNTGEPVGYASSVRIATNSIFMDEERSSHVVLPIIPRRA
jgi:uncharacterized protein